MTAALLDAVLPRWHFRERHSIEVEGSREAVWRAVQEVRADEIPLAHALFAVRRAPARLLGRAQPAPRPASPILANLQAGGFTLLGEEPGAQIVLGTVGRFWTLSPIHVPIADLAAFRAPHAGCAHAAMDMRIEDGAPGRVVLTTETRILVPDRGARLRFALYWSVVRAGSALLRRTWLRAIARRVASARGLTIAAPRT